MTKRWIILGYEIPNEPTRIRVKFWRRLRSLGALYHKMSVCILPNSEHVLGELDELKKELGKFGKVIVLAGSGMTLANDKVISGLFERDRRREYDEIIEECREFLEEIRTNIESDNIKQEEVEELHESLEALKRWFSKVERKAFNPSKARRSAQSMIARCERALLAFAEKSRPMVGSSESY